MFNGSCIYRISSIVHPDRWYYGSAINFRNRFNSHMGALKRGTHKNKKLQNHFNKYGGDDLKFNIIEVVDKPKNLILREQHYLDCDMGWFNICPIAGTSLGIKRTPEQIEKMRKNLIGKKHSQETKDKRGLALTGRIFSDEHKNKIATALKGNKNAVDKVDSFETTLKKRNNNFCSRIVLNTQTGIFYDSASEVSRVFNISNIQLGKKLRGERKNNTTFIYA